MSRRACNDQSLYQCYFIILSTTNMLHTHTYCIVASSSPYITLVRWCTLHGIHVTSVSPTATTRSSFWQQNTRETLKSSPTFGVVTLVREVSDDKIITTNYWPLEFYHYFAWLCVFWSTSYFHSGILIAHWQSNLCISPKLGNECSRRLILNKILDWFW